MTQPRIDNESNCLDRTIHIYGHGILDYKYAQVFSALGFEFHPVTLKTWLRIVLQLDNSHRDKVFHIRYLIWKGYVTTFLMYLLLIASCKIKRIPIVWTCHNIRSHGMPSPRINRWLRKLIGKAAAGIVVLHKDLKQHLAPFEDKVSVACFGEFRTHLRSSQDACPDFSKQYAAWLEERGIAGPDVMFVGEYSRAKQIETLVEACRQAKDVTALIVCPKLPDIETPDNVFAFSQQKVVRELDEILNDQPVIGYAAHNNLSLPTAINLFSSYRRPCIVFDTAPLNTIIRDFGNGAIFRNIPELIAAIRTIRDAYATYSVAARHFDAEHNWKQSQHVHHSLLQQILDRPLHANA